MLHGSIGPIGFLGQDDYENLFAVIRRATTDEMRKFDEAFEAQFIHPPPRAMRE